MTLIYILALIIILIVIAYFYSKGSTKQKEEFNRLNGKLNEQDFNSNTEGTHFSWEEVKPCLDNVLARENYKQHDSCPECNLPSQRLVWINYRSSQQSWSRLAGIAGVLSICPNCKIQVQFVCEIIS